MRETEKAGMSEVNKGLKDEMYFFDTYAFLELIEGNPNYSFYRNVKVIRR